MSSQTKPIPVPPLVEDTIQKLVREALRLPHTDGPFLHLVQSILNLQKMVHVELPGMAEECPPEDKTRCTLPECAAFCKSIGLPETDGEWFFCKMEGAARKGHWMNGNRPVADWKMTIRAWKGSGYMASQKLRPQSFSGNGQPASQPHWANKELDNELKRVRSDL